MGNQVCRTFCEEYSKTQPDTSRWVAYTPPPAITPPRTPIFNKNKENPETSETLENFLSLTINTVNGGTKDVIVPSHFTGGQLKQLIYEKFCQSLEVTDMSVIYEGTVIGNKRKLSDLQIVTGKKLVIKQDKVTVAEVANIISDAEGTDAISLERGVAKMCCGHGIGRDTMTAFIRSLISANKYEIRCPYNDENDLVCNQIWEFKDCRKVGVFTKEEYNQFEQGLSQNWKKKFSKNCPNCKFSICKDGLKTNRVVCPKCGFGSFCYLCLKKWKGGSTCGNEDCVFLNEFLKTCPWDTVFKLRVNGQVQEFKTPQYRSCVHCRMVIEHDKGCKHMACKNCGNSFCWVCLRFPTKGVWPCGSYNEYCGKVAQRQNI